MSDDHKVTAARPTDPFDAMLSRMIGLPNGAHTNPAVVQVIDFYGNATSYMIQTVRTEEQGHTSFITMVTAAGSTRSILPQAVLSAIDRQRGSLTTQIRRRHGRRLAEERKAAGIEPGFMKGKRKRKK